MWKTVWNSNIIVKSNSINISYDADQNINFNSNLNLLPINQISLMNLI